MRKLTSSFLAAIMCLMLAVPFANAEVFLQTDVVEIGVHDSFSFGTSGSQPSGFHGNMFGGKLGFIADYGRDGWTVGTPAFSGDFFVPGSPEEGWGVEWTSPSGTESSFNNFGLMSKFQVPKTSLADTSSGDIQSATWEGTAASGSEQLRINHVVSAKKGDLFFVIGVSMTNVGTATLHSVEYMRNVDPDQEQPWTGDFTTDNWVEFQPPRPATGSRVNLSARPADNTEKALAVARGLTHELTLGLGTIDSRAVVAASHGFSNRDTDGILNNPTQPAPSSPSRADRAIVLAYELGDLAPGQTVSFDYVYILNQDDLEPALHALAALTILQPTGTVSGSSVLFQATTDDVANTDQIEFFVDDVSVGIDTSPDAGGVFEVSFDSTIYPNGSISLKAVASFNDGRESQKLTSVNVDNSGPSVAFSTPVPGQLFNGSGIPVAIDILDTANPPVRVSLFRESASSGVLFLGEDTSEPFTSLFSVSGLPEGETVVIKAVAIDALGRSTTITVSGSVVVNQDPVAVCQNIAVQLDTGGNVSIVANEIDGGSFDPDDGDSISLIVNPTSFDCFDVGHNTVTLTVTDDHGASATCDATVTVQDNLPPVVHTQDITVQLDASGNASIAAGDIDNGSDDTCGIASMSVSQSAFTCGDIGANTVTLTVMDSNGNVGTATATVTVEDNIAPTAVAKNITVQLDASGNASIAAGDIDNGSDDTCGIASMSVSPSVFTCADIGTNTVTLTVTDNNGNVNTATATVTVEDNIAPVLTCPGNIIVQLNTPITEPDVVTFLEAATATDPCDQDVSIINNAPTVFSSPGSYPITFTATDNYVNQSTCEATVAVQYNFSGFLPPVSISKPFKLGSTIPVKFRLTDIDGNYISSATATIRLHKYFGSEPEGDPIEVSSSGSANTGDLFRYDVADQLYIFNFSTSGLSKGSWLISVFLDDGTEKSIMIRLK
jgi:hypothetical protein